MGSKKDIGKVFEEKFKNFEQTPGDSVWNAIASEINQDQKKRILPFWYYFGAAALAIALVSIVVLQPGEQQTIDTNTVVESQKEIIQKTNKSNEIITENNNLREKENKNTIVPKINNKENSKDKINQDKYAYAKSKSKNSSNGITEFEEVNSQILEDRNNIGTTLDEIKNKLSQKPSSHNSKEAKAREAYKAKIQLELDNAIKIQLAESQEALNTFLSNREKDRLAQIEKDKKYSSNHQKAVIIADEKEEKTPKLPKTQEQRQIDREEATTYNFAISPYTSAIRYGSLAKGSSIDNRLANNPRESIGTIGYGIQAEYVLSERSSIRFGVGVSPLKYSTDNFQVSNINGNLNIFQLSGINSQDLNQGGIQTNPEALAFFAQNSIVSIEQDISYVEIPLDYQYRFLNKRVSLSLNPGMSIFLLTENSVFARASNGQSILLGEETDLNSFSLAFNLGLGVHYNFSKHWRLNSEPTFRYQLNPYVDGTSNFRPYYFGVQVGLSYKF